MNSTFPVAIIGGGPAGLTAAYALSLKDFRSIVLESLPQVGGLARTEQHRGFRFDIGGHRFFTKVPAVEKMWFDVLADDFIQRERRSRVYLNGNYFEYPIEPLEVFRKFGAIESLRCGLSFLRSRLRLRSPEHSVEDWLINNFGERLYNHFFKAYTEKVWGMPCSAISAGWAAQRIRGLSFTSLLAASFRKTKPGPKSLIRSFHYPRLGPGMMWERTAEIIEASGSTIRCGVTVEEIHWEPGRVTSIVAGGNRIEAAHFLSSMPVRDLIGALRPRLPELDAVQSCFQYRDFLIVALMLRQSNPFPDHWIYIHEPGLEVARIQNFNNWSPEMVPEPGITCLGLEYFCNERDALWGLSNAELTELARREIGRLKLADPALVIDSAIIRAPKAYPVYNGGHEVGLKAIRRFLATVPNLQLIGRNGMHRYNNQDHSMVAAMRAVENIFGASHDLWSISVEDQYLESGSAISREELAQMEAQQPPVPEAIPSLRSDEMVER